LLDHVRELLDEEGALPGVLVLGQPELLVDDELDGNGAADDSSVGVVIASS
jgi:hypothetical protein